MKNLEKMKEKYMDVPIPDRLDLVVKKTLKESKRNLRRKRSFKKFRTIAASVIIVSLILTVAVNSSPAFANTFSKIPVVGSIVRVLTFNEYIIDQESFNADIKTPAIEGLKNKELENRLNKKYLQENNRLYNQFIENMEDLKEIGKGGHLGVDSGYEIKTDKDRILSVGRYIVNTAGSSSTTIKYDTIDKKEEILITLPSLFKDDSYIEIISQNIKEQMINQNGADENKFYWVEGMDRDIPTERFEQISKEQNFYINSEDKLVISFDKYEVAPGYMGVVEFVIPTKILSDVLVSSEYVK